MRWRPRRHELAWLTVATALLNTLFLIALIHALGAFVMRRFPILLAVAAALCVGGCSTFDPAKFAAAANELDKSPCYKHVKIDVTPMLLFGWYVPVFSGAFEKTCNATQAAPTATPPAAVAGGLQVGALIR